MALLQIGAMCSWSPTLEGGSRRRKSPKATQLRQHQFQRTWKPGLDFQVDQVSHGVVAVGRQLGGGGQKGKAPKENTPDSARTLPIQRTDPSCLPPVRIISLSLSLSLSISLSLSLPHTHTSFPPFLPLPHPDHTYRGTSAHVVPLPASGVRGTSPFRVSSGGRGEQEEGKGEREREGERDRMEWGGRACPSLSKDPSFASASRVQQGELVLDQVPTDGLFHSFQ